MLRVNMYNFDIHNVCALDYESTENVGTIK